MIDHLNDYEVFAARDKDHPQRWHWEIRRKSKPMGIRVAEGGFQSEIAARFAGKRALAEFLDLYRKKNAGAGKSMITTRKQLLQPSPSRTRL